MAKVEKRRTASTRKHRFINGPSALGIDECSVSQIGQQIAGAS
jgi:hypothetical protein